MSAGGDIPVVVIAFKRPRETERVLEAISAYQPQRLYLICDGPRGEEDVQPQAEVLRLFERISWPTCIEKLVAGKNMGVRHRVSSGLNWVFAREQEAIILEDDCVAHPDFFRFCETLLHHYRDDERVMHIGGNNFQKSQRRTPYSYYFSRHTHCWGWATWRRAWEKYDAELSQWEEFKRMRGMADWSNSRLEEDYFMRCLQGVADGSTDSWAYVWGYTCLLHHGFAIVPERNLVSNIGFSSTAAHTKVEKWFSNLATEAIGEILHPPGMLREREADAFTFDHHFDGLDMRRQLHWRQRVRRIGPALKRRARALYQYLTGYKTGTGGNPRQI